MIVARISESRVIVARLSESSTRGNLCQIDTPYSKCQPNLLSRPASTTLHAANPSGQRRSKKPEAHLPQRGGFSANCHCVRGPFASRKLFYPIRHVVGDLGMGLLPILLFCILRY